MPALLGGDLFCRCRDGRQHAEEERVPVTRDDLCGKRVGCSAEILAYVRFDLGGDIAVRADGTRNGTHRDLSAAKLETLERAVHRMCPTPELHTHRHRLGVDTVRTADAQHILRLERTALRDGTDA